MIAKDHIQAYQTDGFAVLPGLIPQDLVGAVNDALSTLMADAGGLDPHNLRYRYKLDPDRGDNVLDAIDPVADVLPPVATVAALPALTQALTAFYGEAPMLYKDKLIVKPAGAPGYPWHQDFIAWPFFPESFTTVMIALDDSHAQNGCLEVFKGSHQKGYLSARDGDFHDLGENLFSSRDRVQVPLSPGDAVVFGCHTVHGSGRNLSGAPRRHLYLSYNKQSDGGDQRAAHYRYFHAWLRRRYGEYGAKQSYFK